MSFETIEIHDIVEGYLFSEMDEIDSSKLVTSVPDMASLPWTHLSVFRNILLSTGWPRYGFLPRDFKNRPFLFG